MRASHMTEKTNKPDHAETRREIVRREVVATHRHMYREREQHLWGQVPLSATGRRILVLHDDAYLGRPGQQLEEMFRSRDDSVTLRWGLEGRDNPDPMMYEVIVVAMNERPPSTVKMELHALLDEARAWGCVLAGIAAGAELFREIGLARKDGGGEDVSQVGQDLFLCSTQDHAADWVRMILDRVDERRIDIAATLEKESDESHESG